MDDSRSTKPVGGFYAAPWEFHDIAFVGYFLSFFVLLYFIVWFVPAIQETGSFRYVALFLTLGLEIGIPLLILRGRKIGPKARVSLKSRIGDCFSGCLTYVLLMPVLMTVASILSYLHEETLAERLNLLRDDSLAFQIFLSIAAFTLVPVAEEVFYRGYIQNVLRKRASVGGAIVMQSVLFALSHPYSITYPFYILCVGVGLGMVYERRKRLLAPIVTHICFNAVGGSLLLLSTLLNVHQPAQNWSEAQDVLSPPSWLVDELSAYLESMEPEEIEEIVVDMTGEDGLAAWKAESTCLLSLAFAAFDEEEFAARLILRVGNLYLENGDPWRAAVLASRMLDWFPENESVLDEARELLSKSIEGLGEEAEIPSPDWGEGETNP
jgi:membrane protease YdiL (CAAX protease family)